MHIEQHVFGFDVPVRDAKSVQIVQSRDDLCKVVVCFMFIATV